MKAEMSKTAKIINILFALGLLMILIIGLVSTVFFPSDINMYENRYAYKLDALSASGFADSSFQDSVENALSDQVNLASYAKKLYNVVNAYLAAPIIRSLEDTLGSSAYVYYNGEPIYNGKILFYCRTTEELTERLAAKADNLNAVFADHDELEFFVYYIEKDTEMNFLSGTKNEGADYFLSRIDLPAENKGCFEISSFEEFDRYFYDTDHHWNYLGSYLAYTQILQMISDEAPLLPTDTFHSGIYFSGSKALKLCGTFTEEMSVYLFSFPKMDIRINGESVSDYGNISGLVDGSIDSVSYQEVYGGDMGEIVFDTGKDGENLLVIGESYDNAVLKLLASHFSKTYSVDLRYYTPHTGKDFDFDEYVKTHDIDKVLLIGNVDYYILEDFMIR